MSSINPGHNTYLPGYKPTQITHHAWRTAENSCAYLLPHLKTLTTTNPSPKLLDVGAGPGTISASLAKYIPQGHILATDLSAEVLQRAKEHAASQGVSNISFQPANVYELPFEDEAFDVVHAQQVFLHLDDPLGALKEMLRVCKTGGVVALREGDLRMWTIHPPNQNLYNFHKLIQDIMRVSGGSTTIGTELVSLALKAGVPREKVQASMGTWCYSTPEEREMWGGAMRDRIVHGEMRKKALGVQRELGWTEDDMDKMADAWDEWIEAEDGCFGCINGEVIITK